MTNFRRFPKNRLIKEVKDRQDAIRLKCFDCMGGGKRKDCQSSDCSLYPYRPWANKQLKVVDFKKE